MESRPWGGLSQFQFLIFLSYPPWIVVDPVRQLWAEQAMGLDEQLGEIKELNRTVQPRLAEEKTRALLFSLGENDLEVWEPDLRENSPPTLAQFDLPPPHFF